MAYLAAVVLLVVHLHSSNGEFFTALADMEKLVPTELKLIQHLEGYIKKEEDKLKRMRR